MQSEYEIKVRLTETIGEIRRLCNKDELFSGCLSLEEYEVLDSLISERDVLQWVLSSAKQCPECKADLVQDSDYPNDLICGHCDKVFDAKTLEFVEAF